MERYTFAVRIKAGMHMSFRRKLGEVWPSLADFLNSHGIHNFSLWSVEDLVFGYCELPDDRVLADAAQREMTTFVRVFEDCVDWLSEPGKTMRLMYHDYGVIRENKELIRYRVFVTKLKPGCAEEYKRRHDRLIAERGDKVNPGPGSNCSIWNAGDYIFGYSELDTTMEPERTLKSREGSRQWETKQLEIMEWVTDDMDWLTGEHHMPIDRIAWHG